MHAFDVGFQSRGSNRDQVYLSIETSKNLGHIYETIALKKLNIRHQKTMILEKQGTKEMSPLIAPPYCTERVSRPPCKDREPRWASRLPGLRIQSWESREVKVVRVHNAEYQGRQWHREKMSEIYSGSSVRIPLSSDQ